MSNKLLSLFELMKLNFPVNPFVAIDFSNVPANQVDSFINEGLAFFKSRVNCDRVLLRSGLSGCHEVQLPLANDLPYNDDKLIITKIREILTKLKSNAALNDAFIIIQKWTPDSDYLFSANLLPLNDSLVFDVALGNHISLDRANRINCALKLSGNKLEVIKSSLAGNDLFRLQGLINKLVSKYNFVDGNVYEFSFLKDGLTFYQIKKPGKLVKQPLSKIDFYKKLGELKIDSSNILRKQI